MMTIAPSTECTWCLSGCQPKYSDQFVDLEGGGLCCAGCGYGCCCCVTHYPCMAPKVAEIWEKERKYFKDGALCEGVCCGLGLRVARTAVTAYDVAISLVACPILCVGGAVLACGCETASCCCCAIEKTSSLCLSENSSWRKRVKSDSSKANTAACTLFLNSMKLSGLGAVNTLLNMIRFPFNIIAPEACELCCYQEEIALKINQCSVGRPYCLPNTSATAK